MKSRHDFTRKKWFSDKKNHSSSNLLFEIIPNFGYMKTFGLNTLNNVTHYLGGYNRTMNRYTGYVMSWDKKHCCDRCGKALKYTGSKSVRLAYGVTKFKRLKECGLCAECDAQLEREIEKDNIDGIIQYSGGVRRYITTPRRQPRDYKDRYIWL